MREDEVGVILAEIAGKSRVSFTSGLFISYDASGCVVEIGNGRIPASFMTSYLPEVGEQVLVAMIDGVPFVTGPSVPRPAVGTVTAVASGRVTLDTAVGSIGPIPYLGSAPAVGAVIRIMWHGGGVAYTATDAVIPAPPPPPPAPATRLRTDTFTAIGTGTWNTGGGDAATSYFNDEVWASNTTIGFWFYGTKIKDTLPASARPVRLQIYVAARQLQGGAPRFTLHGHPNPPGASLAGGNEIGVSNYAWIDLPAAWITDLRTGGGAYGVGTRHGGYNIFKSLRNDGQSGALRITSEY